PLAKVMRTELKKRKIKKVKVLFSTETAIKKKRTEKAPQEETEVRSGTGRPVPASVSFVPGVAGLMIAGEVIKDLVFNKK
ncbi:MAG: tRNA threonylcarbamoyladenosine dehydratase, partial [Blautia producta]